MLDHLFHSQEFVLNRSNQNYRIRVRVIVKETHTHTCVCLYTYMNLQIIHTEIHTHIHIGNTVIKKWKECTYLLIEEWLILISYIYSMYTILDISK